MHPYFNKFQFDNHPIIDSEVSIGLGISVVIPCFNESYVLDSIQSLQECDSPNYDVEIIVVVNCSENSDEATKSFQKKTHQSIEEFAEKNLKFPVYSILRTELPKKHAGVGLARKIGMDEASFRLLQSQNPTKTIVCYDADSKCDKNYLVEIEKTFLQDKITGASIHYEHPISGTDFDAHIYSGIINYELFLRYYNLGLKYADLPYAYHTVGSSMACTVESYLKQGGMNRRKAGEDFYFIHKIIALGHFDEIKTTKVIPSPRISDRVPFGTGKAIGDWVENEKNQYETYAFESFQAIKDFVSQLESFYLNGLDIDSIPSILKTYLKENGIEEAWQDALKNASNFDNFKKRFFTWFGPFRIMKMLHYLRDEVNGLNDLFKQVNKLLLAMNVEQECQDVKEQLLLLRKIESQ